MESKGDGVGTEAAGGVDGVVASTTGASFLSTGALADGVVTAGGVAAYGSSAGAEYDATIALDDMIASAVMFSKLSSALSGARGFVGIDVTLLVSAAEDAVSAPASKSTPRIAAATASAAAFTAASSNATTSSMTTPDALELAPVLCPSSLPSAYSTAGVKYLSYTSVGIISLITLRTGVDFRTPIDSNRSISRSVRSTTSRNTSSLDPSVCTKSKTSAKPPAPRDARSTKSFTAPMAILGATNAICVASSRARCVADTFTRDVELDPFVDDVSAYSRAYSRGSSSSSAPLFLICISDPSPAGPFKGTILRFGPFRVGGLRLSSPEAHGRMSKPRGMARANDVTS